jgi:histidine ammonia-lyase
MGYNAAKKAGRVADKLEYVLAIELLSAYQAHQFVDRQLSPGTVTQAVLARIARQVPPIEEDIYLYPPIQSLRELIHSGELIRLAEEKMGPLM